jgi:hypothetical protein
MAVTINADNGVSSGSAGLKQTADSSGVLALQTNGTTAFTVDTSQNVGIGTASPSNTLQVTGTSYTTGKTYIGNNTNFTNVGNLGWSPAFIVEDTNGQGIAAVRNTADAYGGTINLVKSRGTLASPSAVTNGDRLGQIYFGGYDSVDYSNTGASIEAIANATWTSNSCPSDLVFSTTTSGSFVATERMRIDSSGNLLVGTTTAQTGAVLAVTGGIQGTIKSGTAVASTSGTSIDFTGIPSWVKRITVMFAGVSTSGSSPIQIQIGTSGGIQATSYTSGAWIANTTNTNSTTGLLITAGGGATYLWDGMAYLTLLNSGTGLWTFNSIFSGSVSGINSIGGGAKTLSGTLDRVRITTVNGTDTFDAGTINILYEG